MKYTKEQYDKLFDYINEIRNKDLKFDEYQKNLFDRVLSSSDRMKTIYAMSKNEQTVESIIKNKPFAYYILQQPETAKLFALKIATDAKDKEIVLELFKRKDVATEKSGKTYEEAIKLLDNQLYHYVNNNGSEFHENAIKYIEKTYGNALYHTPIRFITDKAFIEEIAKTFPNNTYFTTEVVNNKNLPDEIRDYMYSKGYDIDSIHSFTPAIATDIYYSTMMTIEDDLTHPSDSGTLMMKLLVAAIKTNKLPPNIQKSAIDTCIENIDIAKDNGWKQAEENFKKIFGVILSDTQDKDVLEYAIKKCGDIDDSRLGEIFFNDNLPKDILHSKIDKIAERLEKGGELSTNDNAALITASSPLFGFKNTQQYNIVFNSEQTPVPVKAYIAQDARAPRDLLQKITENHSNEREKYQALYACLNLGFNKPSEVGEGLWVKHPYYTEMLNIINREPESLEKLITGYDKNPSYNITLHHIKKKNFENIMECINIAKQHADNAKFEEGSVYFEGLLKEMQRSYDKDNAFEQMGVKIAERKETYIRLQNDMESFLNKTEDTLEKNLSKLEPFELESLKKQLIISMNIEFLDVSNKAIANLYVNLDKYTKCFNAIEKEMEKQKNISIDKENIEETR